MSAEEIREMIVKGYTYKEVSEKLGVNKLKLYTMEILGLIPIRKYESKYTKVLNEIVRLYNEGRTYNEIAKTLGLSKSVVASILSMLHRMDKLPYKLKIKTIQTKFKPMIEKFIQDNNVFTTQDIMGLLKSVGVNASYETVHRILESMYESGEIKKVNIKALKSFLTRKFPSIIYYTNDDALIEYLTKHLHISNKRAFANKMIRVKLPEDVKRRIKLACWWE